MEPGQSVEITQYLLTIELKAQHCMFTHCALCSQSKDQACILTRESHVVQRKRQRRLMLRKGERESPEERNWRVWVVRQGIPIDSFVQGTTEK
jgi:hypothetical protein